MFEVFISTAHQDPKDEQVNTGDIDYAGKIFQLTNQISPGKIDLIRELFEEQKIYEYIEKNGAPSPTLHIMINPPKTGMAFSIDNLQAFKEKHNVKIIITVIEFAKFIDTKEAFNNINKTLKFLNIADQIIFLDNSDKDNAYIFANQSLKSKIQQGSVIPVLPTIEQVTSIDPLMREKNIVCFGMIRTGKGLGLVIELAKQLKAQQIHDKKVLVIGALQETRGSLKELKRLMQSLYTTKEQDIEAKTTVNELKTLLIQYNSDPTIIKELPLEIHVDVPKQELKALFNRCTYAFMPAYRGATLRNSSISSCIAQHFIVYSHVSEITPPELLANGVFAKSLMLFEGFNGRNGANYINWVIDNILKQDQNIDLRKESIDAMDMLMAQQLCSTYIAQKHIDLYYGNYVESKDQQLDSDQSLKKVAPFFYLWYSEFKKQRAYKQFKQIHDIDITDSSKDNWLKLLRRLGKLKKEEIMFFDVLMNSDWYLSHATNEYSAIQKSNYKLLSLKERSRKDPKLAANRNTNPFEGNDDNIFFAFGPGKVASPQFLENAKYVVEVDINKGLAEKTSSLHGVWSSGHIYAFGTEQDGDPINVHGTVFNVSYRKVDPNGLNAASNFLKICTFKYADGSTHQQTLKVKDEIFDDRYLRQALILMTIEKIRLLGEKAWQKIIGSETSLADKQQIVKDLFHVGIFEVHKPAEFSLKQSFVQVSFLNQQQTLTSFFTYSYDHPLLKAIEAADLEEAEKQLISPSADMRAVFASPNYLDKTPLTAAIFANHEHMVHWCLDKGAKISQKYPISCTKNNYEIVQSIIISVVALASPHVQLWIKGSVGPNSDLFKKYLDLLLNYGSAVSMNSHIRQCAVISELDIIAAIQIFELPEDDLCYLVERATNIRPKKLPIVAATNKGYKKLVQIMLNMGANVNRVYKTKNTILPDDPLQWFTPLMQATLNEDIEMVKLLLNCKADVHVVYTCDHSTGIKNLNGMTALQMIINKDSVEAKKIIQLLKNHGAILENRSSWTSIPVDSNIIKVFAIDVVFMSQNELGEKYILLKNNKNIVSFVSMPVGTIFDLKSLFLKIFNSMGIDINTERYGCLQECGLSVSYETKKFYGHQLCYFTVPVQMLEVLKESLDDDGMTAIKLSNLTDLSFKFSPYVLSVLEALQQGECDPDGNYTLKACDLEKIKTAWVTEKQQCLKLREFIDNSNQESFDLENFKKLLIDSKNIININNICFSDDLPEQLLHLRDDDLSPKGISPIRLAIYYKNINCIIELLKIILDNLDLTKMSHHDLYKYKQYIKDCIEVSLQKNDVTLLDFFVNTLIKKFFNRYLDNHSYEIDNLLKQYPTASNVEKWFTDYKDQRKILLNLPKVRL